MLRGEPPDAAGRRALLEAALVAGVDHGPQAPSIAVARMAVTCGVGLNNAMASGVNMLGDVHGGAGQQCVELLDEIVARPAPAADLSTTPRPRSSRGGGPARRYLPGFGHRFHPVDPRRDPLLALVDRPWRTASSPGGTCARRSPSRRCSTAGRDRPVPMNIDGATAVIYAELGFPAPLARGLVRPQPQRRHPRPRLGGDGPGPAQQGPDPALDPAGVRTAPGTPAPRTEVGR